jgi:plastocyanin
VNVFHHIMIAGLFAAGCDKSSPPQGTPVAPPGEAPVVANPPRDPAPARDPTPPPAVGPVGTVVGKIAFSGAAPEMKELPRFTASGKPRDPGCTTHEKAEWLVVTGGGVKDTLVRLAVGDAKDPGPPPAEPAVMDQKQCLYLPHVLAVRTGQKVAFKNSDPSMHNVHSFVGEKDNFNDISRPESTIVHDVPVPAGDQEFGVRCDLHPWMEAHIVVTDHPYFVVTGEGGSFKLDNVPAGKHKLEAWHPHLGVRTAEVTVEAGKTVEARFPPYQPSDFKAPVPP